MNSAYILIVETETEGEMDQTFYGPFTTHAEAWDFGKDKLKVDDFWVSELKDPPI